MRYVKKNGNRTGSPIQKRYDRDSRKQEKLKRSTKSLKNAAKARMASFCLGQILGLVGIAPAVFAEQASKSEDHADAISITFATRQSASRDVMNAVGFDVSLSNLAQSPIIVSGIQIDVQEPVPGTRENISWNRSEGGDITLAPGTTARRTLSMPSLDHSWYQYWAALARNPRLLTFAPGEYDATVIVDYKLPPNASLQLTKTAKLTFSSALGAVVIGTIVGSILGLLFRSAWRLTREKPRPRLADELLDAGLAFPAGVLGAIIVSLILYRLKDVQLPIAVTVNDFFGGIVVGLFTYKLADWIYQKLFGDGSVDTSSKAA
jgi:hypothetical protein